MMSENSKLVINRGQIRYFYILSRHESPQSPSRYISQIFMFNGTFRMLINVGRILVVCGTLSGLHSLIKKHEGTIEAYDILFQKLSFYTVNNTVILGVMEVLSSCVGQPLG